MDMMVLHWSLIPDNEIRMANQIGQMRVLLDKTNRRFVNVDGNFESGVSSTAAFEKKSRNARGCDADHNLALTTEVMAKGVVDKGFSCSPWTVKEEGLA
jgi:hypothetical protein